MGLPTPEEWFREFVGDFVRSVDLAESEVGVLYANREQIHFDDAYYTNREWTEVMSRFLARLARRMGYVQLSERDHLDFVWYLGDGAKRRVAIEHENQRGGIAKSEIPKLANSRAALRILITYTNADGTGRVAENTCLKAEGRLRRYWKRNTEGRFLLVIGRGWLDDPKAWLGLEWNPRTAALEYLSNEPREKTCNRCGESFWAWYPRDPHCS